MTQKSAAHKPHSHANESHEPASPHTHAHGKSSHAEMSEHKAAHTKTKKPTSAYQDFLSVPVASLLAFQASILHAWMNGWDNLSGRLREPVHPDSPRKNR